ncbi:hypothetical protein HYFRA_00005425 [Hymenoscyphus fraxineus]|uniref:Uncharacterized protein n=1 Tax=Hymenoscyphus fraxineus TaxID=746836 RepID=A0A9N9KPG9_9HELO|nr:hypothetical protein HYFRA_00005425 [Hymenoscyphus fraxineus]
MSRLPRKQAQGIELRNISETTHTRIAIIGFGARGRLTLCSTIATELAELWQRKRLSRKPRIHEYFEEQAENEGPGVAFQLDSKAPLNTGMLGPMPLDTTGLTPRQRKIVEHLTDVAGNYSRILMADREKTLVKMQSENVASSIVFARASRDGTLDTEIACGPRDIVGQVLNDMTREALHLAKEYLPWLEIRVRFDTRVTDIHLSNPQKPVLTIKGSTGLDEDLQYDMIFKTTGTTSLSPVTGTVAVNAFTGIPGPKAIFEYLEKRNLMDSGLIKPGTKILIGGSSLSAFDPVGILLTRTGIVSLDSKGGWTINKERSSQYQGLITFFSRTDGDAIRPRHLIDFERASDRLEQAALFTPEMLLSLQVQEGLDQYHTSLSIGRLITAVYFEKLPQDIEPGRTTADLITYMSNENNRWAAEVDREAPQLSELGVFRESFLGVVDLALGLKPAEKRDDLESRFPLVFREIGARYNAMSFNQTHDSSTRKISLEDSQSWRSEVRLFSSFITASPFPVHHLFTHLTEIGVIKWEQGDYNDVSWSDKTQLFEVDGNTGNALFAAWILTGKADLLSQKIFAKLKHVPGDRIYDKGRFLRASHGPCHLMEHGIIGHGMFHEGRFLNAQWNDTNDLEAAQETIPRFVAAIRMFEDMLANRIPNPVVHLMELYEKTLPSKRQFSEQTALLQEPFINLGEIHAFADLAAVAYPNGKEFSEKMQRAKDRDVRRALFQEIRKLEGSDLEKACKRYEAQVGSIKFQPLDLKSFEEMAPDFSQQQLREMRRLLNRELDLLEGVKQIDSAESADITQGTTNTQRRGPMAVMKLYRLKIYILILSFFARFSNRENIDTLPRMDYLRQN